MMGVIVGIDRLGLKTSYRVKLLDRRRAQTSKRAEDRTLDFRDLCVLDRIDQRVLRLCRVVLQLLCGVLLTEGSNLVEVHLEVVRHLLRKVILGGRRHAGRSDEEE